MMRWTFSVVVAVAVVIGAAAMAAAGNREPSTLRFQERTVAGTDRDLMIVRYLRLEGSNAQIGARLAEIARERHGSTGDTAPGALATEQLAWVTTNWPEMAERAEGV